MLSASYEMSSYSNGCAYQELIVPLLPPPRAPPPDFSLGRLNQTASRLFVAVEPFYSQIAVPLLKLATWRDTKTSFGYCAVRVFRP